MHCTFVVHREANNERWQNVITPASYCEGTAGRFYFRLPSGKESTHLPVVKTQPPHSYGCACAGRRKRPHDKIDIIGSPAVEIGMPTGDEVIHCKLTISIKIILMTR